MEKKIKVLVLPSDRHGCAKYRSLDPHVYIEENYSDEFDIDIVYDLPKDGLEDYLKKYDIIHLHKQLDKAGKAVELIKFLGIPLIVDVDDNFYIGDDHPLSLIAKREKTHEPIINALRKADHVTTTTALYADVLRKYNKNVTVLPNAVNPDERQFSLKKNPRNGRLRVGIVCGSTHLKDIELLDGITTQIDKEKVQLVLCGFDLRGTMTITNPDGTSYKRPIKPHESVWCKYEHILTDGYKGLSDEHKKFLFQFRQFTDDPFEDEYYRRMWTRHISEYATHYANIDVLIAPLKENSFNYVKSNLKEIECGFTHTAFIGQNYGPYTLDLKHAIEKGGKVNKEGNALLVDGVKNHKQWGKFINRLANDDELLKMLQDNLYETVKDKYSIDAVCRDRVELYRSIAGRSSKQVGSDTDNTNTNITISTRQKKAKENGR